jgi:isopenicillin N synthase-like dioxygenase
LGEQALFFYWAMHLQKLKNRRFFRLPEQEKENLVPAPKSFQQGYFGMEKEKIRGQRCIKENFDFGNPKDDTLGSWPIEDQLPGFRDVAEKFYQVWAAKMSILHYLT